MSKGCGLDSSENRLKSPAQAGLFFFNYFIIISPPRDSGRLIITIPTLLLGICNSQFISGIDFVALSAIRDGI